MSSDSDFGWTTNLNDKIKKHIGCIFMSDRGYVDAAILNQLGFKTFHGINYIQY